MLFRMNVLEGYQFYESLSESITKKLKRYKQLLKILHNKPEIFE